MAGDSKSMLSKAHATRAIRFTREDSFRKELRNLLNHHTMENASDTPDYVLANYLASCLVAFDAATRERERWYGRRENPTSSLAGRNPEEGATSEGAQ